jgi:hypothetical protein
MIAIVIQALILERDLVAKVVARNLLVLIV